MHIGGQSGSAARLTRTANSGLSQETSVEMPIRNIFKDLFANIRVVVGERSAAYENELRKAREIAFEELQSAAAELGVNAVLGIDIDYETVGAQSGMLMISVRGTAVTVA
jgi:uncharacterized protein YbjQ (UPF0145 family)